MHWLSAAFRHLAPDGPLSSVDTVRLPIFGAQWATGGHIQCLHSSCFVEYGFLKITKSQNVGNIQ